MQKIIEKYPGWCLLAGVIVLLAVLNLIGQVADQRAEQHCKELFGRGTDGVVGMPDLSGIGILADGQIGPGIPTTCRK